jgi:hypothetical protein
VQRWTIGRQLYVWMMPCFHNSNDGTIATVQES